MLSIESIKETVAKVSKKYGVKKAYLFGSFAKKTATEKSDVDILIDRGKIRGYLQLNGYRLELADELGADVDVVTTSGAPKKFLESIETNRILLYGA